MACCAYGPARLPEDGSGEAYTGWGEVWSFYADPAETGRGYGGILMEEVLRRLAQDGFPACFVLVLRENEGAGGFMPAMDLPGTGPMWISPSPTIWSA